MIRKVRNKKRWQVLSENTYLNKKTGKWLHRSFGTYPSKKAAKKRLGEVEYFKHAKG